MLSGLSAFPLTPVGDGGVDEKAFAKLMERLVSAKVDSIGVLGSTGSYAYLRREERARVAKLAVEHANGIPVMIGIGAISTRDVLELAKDAQKCGASAVLLAPVSYQKLTAGEVYGLYESVCKTLSIPLCVYDNPGTTHFEFSDDLHARIAQLPNVKSIKIPGVPPALADARSRVDRLREKIPSDVSIGVSGDAFAATGLNAGCDAWYSVIGGLLPDTCLAISRAAQAGNADEATQLSARLEPLWALFRQHGSLRVVSAIAEELGLVSAQNLPLPVRALRYEDRVLVRRTVSDLELTT
ncbi:UNVERIFIED_ORG: 4-hydroxy-tetrahydrodipicolinate synthase [Burkholderia sp. 1595]|uniref:4-hydroxy-tetrahydrodipicolinate synthase n=1 Tax=Paraburkholderia terricola TaxID=169427 RepID=A0ABU1M2P7_9BURK|nr:dihydrodipicolinate synthase family protein [Paraburkholderia terricola]MDR6413283.1 4-hydroxy-tetrahydrodipicolinate synthase [Paraburkholderia terricola]